MPLEEIRKIGGGLLDPALLPRREHQEVERPYRTGLRQPRRPLLEDEVGVGAPDAEGADAGPQRAGRGPGGETIDDVERAARQLEPGVGLLEVKAGRELA